MNPAVLSSSSSVLVVLMASFLIWVLFAGLFFLWAIDGRVKKEQALHALFSSVLAWVLAQMIKEFFPSLRPFELNGGPPLTLTVPFDAAFPSGHSATAFGMAASIWLHDKKLGILFVLGAVLVGAGRVLGNVHFVIDIIGGAVVGISVAYLVERLHLFKLVRE